MNTTKRKLPRQRNGRRRSAAPLGFGFAAGLAACLTTVAPPPEIGYQNPLDWLDAGTSAFDGGTPDGGGANYSQGTVDGRSPDLTAAVYLVADLDSGQLRTEILLGDVTDLCAFTPTPSYDLVSIRLAGDVPGTYPVGLAISPSGATASLQYHSDAGAFGTVPAIAGEMELEGIDPGNQQPAQGLYTLTFSATEALSGRFLAQPCAGLTPPAGD